MFKKTIGIVTAGVLAVGILVMSLLPSPTTVQSSWWDSNWKYRKKLLFNTSVMPFTANESFSIVLIPDTQYYSQGAPYLFNSQTNWIAANKETKNIEFVIHLGDIVNVYNSTYQWSNADIAMDTLDGIVPYSVSPGNHDNRPEASGNFVDNSYFNTYFGTDRFKNYSWYQGNYPVDGNENNFNFFSAGGIDFAILTLEFTPPSDVLDWANTIVSSNPNRMFIIETHSYLHGSGERTKYSGDAIWESLVSNHSNIFLVVTGHHYARDPVIRTSVGNNGNKVFEVIVNYQNMPPLGGNGWLAMMEFSEDNLVIREYNTYYDQYDKVINFSDNYTDNFTDYQIIVNLDTSKVDFGKLDANGSDIRFTDQDGTLLKHLITDWNNISEKATLVVRVPQIDANSLFSDYIYMYYGNPSVIDGQSTIQEVLGTTNPDVVLNNPLYGLPGTSWNSPDLNEYLNTVIGTTWTPYGRSFEGIDDYISFPSNLMPPSGTITGWILWGNSSVERDNHQYLFSNFLYQHKSNDFLYLSGGPMHFLLKPKPNAWNYLTITWEDKTDSSTTELFIDATKSGRGAVYSYGIEGIVGLARHSSGSGYTQAKIGEVKVYNKVLTTSYIWSDYWATKWRYEPNNIKYGVEESLDLP